MRKIFGTVFTYDEDGKNIMKPIRVWVHFASKNNPPVIDINLTELPPIPAGCHRSLNVTYKMLGKGMRGGKR